MTHMELLLTCEEYIAVDSIRGHEQDVHYAVILAKEIDERVALEHELVAAKAALAATKQRPV